MANWNAELFTKLYSKLALALGVIPDSEKAFALENNSIRPSMIRANNSQEASYLLAIYNPGQYIPSGMKPLTSDDDNYALSVLFDVVPQFSWVFKTASSTVSNVYSDILNYKEFPDTHLTDKEKTQLEDAEAYYEANIDAYRKYRDIYLVILDEYDAAKATYDNGGPPVPKSLIIKRDDAKKDWDVLGHRVKVDVAAATVTQLGAKEPAAFWQKLQDRYENATLQNSASSDFQPVGFAPPYDDWFKDAGWTSFTFDQTDMDNQTTSEIIGVSGNLDLEFGIFKVSGDGDFSQDSTYKKMDETKLNFSCDLKRVSLDRGWMNPLLFSSSAWRWAKGTPSYGVSISSGGDLKADIPPTGVMTALPTAAILSRNLKIFGTFDNTLVQELNREINANASVGIGPFTIAGRFNMENHDGSVKGSIATNEIKASDVQIIALVCEILPECPNPDNTLPWPS